MSFFRDRLNFFVIGLWKNGTPFKVPVRFSMFFLGISETILGCFLTGMQVNVGQPSWKKRLHRGSE